VGFAAIRKNRLVGAVDLRPQQRDAEQLLVEPLRAVDVAGGNFEPGGNVGLEHGGSPVVRAKGTTTGCATATDSLLSVGCALAHGFFFDWHSERGTVRRGAPYAGSSGVVSAPASNCNRFRNCIRTSS